MSTPYSHAHSDGEANEARIEPEPPQDEGIEPVQPTIEKVEPVHLLANEAREQLRAAGFDDTQIDDWARAYFADHTSGTAEDLIDWIAARQDQRPG